MATNPRRNTRWSWSALVKEHGEAAALALLQYQPGLGCFTEDSTPTLPDRARQPKGWQPIPWGPWDEVHDEVPYSVMPEPMDGGIMVDLAVATPEDWLARHGVRPLRWGPEHRGAWDKIASR